MPYEQCIEGCFSEALGENGLDRAEYDSVLARTADALTDLRSRHEDGSLPLLNLPAERDDLDSLAPIVKRYGETFSQVVVLGTGGSSLGAKTLYGLAGDAFGVAPPYDPKAPRLHFMDNIDPHSFSHLLQALDLARTGFLVVSKSGSTPETLTQFLTCFEAVSRDVGEKKATAHFTLIAEPGSNPLRGLGKALGMEILDHDPQLGGRFSVLSLVGVLPAMMAGVDAVSLRQGAAAVLDPILEGARPQDCPPAVGAALAVALAQTRGVSMTVLMPYLDRLDSFALWFRQLWAESLGKGGQGTTPIKALGAVDQHSQLQLYLDGPADKMFTLILSEVAGSGARMDPALAKDGYLDGALAWLAGHTMGDLLAAEQQATAETLVRHHRPLRVLDIKRLDEWVLGGLLMHFMIETIIAAHLLGVDAFDQPAVEESKVLARASFEMD